MASSARHNPRVKVRCGRLPASRPSGLRANLLVAWLLSSLLPGCAFFGTPPFRAAPSAGADVVIPPGGGAADIAGRRGLVKSGTGFFVARGGLLLTSAHVVVDCPAISVRQNGRTARWTRLIALDPRADLALVASDLTPLRIATVAAVGQMSNGDRVFGLGYEVPGSRPPEPVLIRGSFAGRATAPSGAAAFLIRTRVLAGASGGLVVDKTGGLLGMILGYDTDYPDFGIVVANSEIDRFMAANAVPLSHAPVRPGNSAAVERRLIETSALVQCAPEPEWSGADRLRANGARSEAPARS